MPSILCVTAAIVMAMIAAPPALAQSFTPYAPAGIWQSPDTPTPETQPAWSHASTEHHFVPDGHGDYTTYRGDGSISALTAADGYGGYRVHSVAPGEQAPLPWEMKAMPHADFERLMPRNNLP